MTFDEAYEVNRTHPVWRTSWDKPKSCWPIGQLPKHPKEYWKYDRTATDWEIFPGWKHFGYAED